MLKYLHTTEYNEEFKEVILDFSVDQSLKNGYLISNSLGSDIFGDFETVSWEIESLLELLLGKTSLYKGGGNVNLIRSDKYFTIIEDIFTEEDEEQGVCQIETIEYLKIIVVWAKENFLYKCTRGAISKEQAELIINWLNKKYVDINKLESY
ncbi:hypothetical protein [Saccharibacillus deserti]|uniref:hypothetical protein n=1 Tax=Saccharibacillus deserti TaxID=1634444 RepID=UPI001553DAEA|nr:hypothetical protein [Saccharibacillus deserti]